MNDDTGDISSKSQWSILRSSGQLNTVSQDETQHHEVLCPQVEPGILSNHPETPKTFNFILLIQMFQGCIRMDGRMWCVKNGLNRKYQ